MSTPSDFLGHVEQDYPDYLRDESRRTGSAESLSFPLDEAGVKAHLRAALELGRPVTIQGGRTGITGGAVPSGGHILSLSKMNRFLGLRRAPTPGAFVLTVQPGVLLSEIREAVATREFGSDSWSPESLAALEELRAGGPLFFPPDPTETSAAIGGMVACNASGARSFSFGPTRDYVVRLKVVLYDGTSLEVSRGGAQAKGRAFEVQTNDGRTIAGSIPAYAMPSVKSAAGYFARDDMDLIDLFIGSEGTLGAFAEIDILLVPAPACVWGAMAFFPGEAEALSFVRDVRGDAARPAAIEFFDADVLNLLRRQKEESEAFKEIPDMPEAWHTAIYVEYNGPDEETVEAAVMAASEKMAACGGDPDATWLTTNERELERLKAFRHAVPEAVNLQIDERRKREPGLTKLGTDLAVPDGELEAVIALYHQGLTEAGLESVIFGHIGDNHVHVNIIPNDNAEYLRGKALYLQWADAVVAMGGTVSAEHGIGKLKTTMLRRMVGDEGIREMRELKRSFDPRGVLNPGNLFE